MTIIARPRMARPWLRHALVCTALVCTALMAGAVAAADPPAATAGAATYVGQKACVTCHQSLEKHYGWTAHDKTFNRNPRNELESRGCEACHGPGSLHMQDATNHDGLIGFTRGWGTPIDVQNGQCLACHTGDQRIHWPGSAHSSNKLACADCHNPMARISVGGLQRTTSISETCFTCHPQQRAEFHRRSHMPVPEGKLGCTDCHNPHGSLTRPLLKAENVTTLCYTCHAEKRGPFLWEHAPVRENCMNCHQPHGSNHDKLLTAARPYLCQQCHNAAVGHPGQFFRGDQTAAAATQGGAQSARVIGRSCQNCHTQIHGSNHPSGARFQR